MDHPAIATTSGGNGFFAHSPYIFVPLEGPPSFAITTTCFSDSPLTLHNAHVRSVSRVPSALASNESRVQLPKLWPRGSRERACR